MQTTPARNRLWILALLSALLLGMPDRILAQTKSGNISAAPQAKSQSISAAPLVFEQNKGQLPAEYEFRARRGAMDTLYRANGVDVLIPTTKSASAPLQIRWIGANSSSILQGLDALPGRSNYLHGNDPSRWVRGVPQFGRIEYAGIYPGVDLVFHGTGEMLEEDFVVAPGTQSNEIEVQLNRRARLTRDGDLEISIGESSIDLMRPVAYQDDDGVRKGVSARFVLARNGKVKFAIGAYDHAKPLIIDPIFAFSTYLDGTGTDVIQAVTTDSAGNVYVTGATSSLDFPIVNGLQTVCSGCGSDNNNPDVFISKLDPTGHTLLYSTYVGGSQIDAGYSIAVDSNGNILVAGLSTSSNFPQAGSLQPVSCSINGNCFFLLSLKPDGSAFNYSGLVGGLRGGYEGEKLAVLTVDGSGNAYLAGATDSTLQVTPGTVGSSFSGYYEVGFVMKFDPSGKLVYSTVLPGTAPPNPSLPTTDLFLPQGIAADANGDVTIAGFGGLGLPTTSGVLQGTFPNNPNAETPIAGFVLQLNPAATSFNYVTYVPGTDNIFGLAVDGNGNSFVAGQTAETNLPVSANAFQKTLSSNPNCNCSGGFVAKIDSLGKTMPVATYLSGGQGSEITYLTGIALDSHANVFVGGGSNSNDFPLLNPFMPAVEIAFFSQETVMAQMSPDLSTLSFGSYLGAEDYGSALSAVTMDSQNNAIVVGTTTSSYFPTTSESFQSALPGGSNSSETGPHSFISKINLSAPAASACLSTIFLNFGTTLVNQPNSQSLSVQNCGNAALQFTSLVSSSPTVTATQTCGSIAPGASCKIQVTFTPVDTNPVTGTVTLNDNAAIPALVVNVSGTGGLPQPFYPSTVTFPDLLVGTQTTTFFSISNEGTANYVVTNATTTGDFSLTTGCATPLVPGGSCTVVVAFAPTQAGTRTGTLTLTDNAPGSPHVIQLTGNGLASYPTPSITAIIAVPMDAQTPQLDIFGTNFFPASQVTVRGTSRTAFYQNEGYLAVNITSADIAQMGELQVIVSNPTPGGGASNAAVADVYTPIRNIGILQSVYEPVSGMLFASVSTTSQKYANQVVEINPATAQVVKTLSVGNGPTQLAVSDDGSMLYVGLNGDKKVAQVSLPSGTVNFATAIGSDTSGPFVADALRVFPGQPHSWAVTLCGNYDPCGNGVAVFDDGVERPTRVSTSELQPDALLFVGTDTTTLFGTNFFNGLPNFYQFTINSSGITLTNTVQSFGNQPAGGGYLDTDGTSIYVSNGEVINPTTLALASAIQGAPTLGSLKVDVPTSQIYFAGQMPGPPQGNFLSFGIEAYGLQNQQLNGTIFTYENPPANDVFRWGTNGLGVSAGGDVFLFKTSLVGPVPEISVSGTMNASVTSGSAASYSLTVAPLGGFTGQVSFSCSNLPQYASCSFTPNGTTLSGAAVNFTAMISTSPQQAQLIEPRSGLRFAALYWLAALALFALVGRVRLQRGSLALRLAASALAFMLIFVPLTACGGGSGYGGGGGGGGGGAEDTPKGTYTVNLTASGGNVSQTIQLTLVVQ